MDSRAATADEYALGWGIATGVYLVAALVYFAAPIWQTFGESLLGTSQFGPDNTLNAGILEWGTKALRDRSLSLFDWPPGYPVHNTLAGTENLIGWQPLFLPQRLLGVGIVAADNVCVLLSFVVSGIVANLFARRCGVTPAGALVAGFVFAFAPQHVAQAVQFQSLAICWLPLGIVALERVVAERGVAAIALLAAVVVVTVLSSLYYGVFLVIILGTWYAVGLVTRRFPRSWMSVARLAAAAVPAAIVLYPIVVPYLRTSSAFGFDRSIDYAIERSITLVDFLQLPRWLLLWGKSPLAQRSAYGAAFPGFVLLLLLVASVRWRAPRPLKYSLLAAAAVCTILSLGPRLKVFDYPTSLLANVPMPGAILSFIPGIRMPSRLLPCALIFLAVLAGGGASVLFAWRPQWRPFAVPVGLVLVVLDVYPAPSFASASRRLQPPLATSDAYSYLASSSDTTPVVEWPAADSTGFRLAATAEYAYGSVGHQRRVVSYNLSIDLAAADSLQARADQLPDEASRQLLVARGVRRLIIHRRFAKADSIAAHLARLEAAGYRTLFRGRDATVYSLEPPSVSLGTLPPR